MKHQSGALILDILVAISLLLIVGFIAAWVVMPIGIGQDISANCHVNGLGNGSCSFTNTGWSPGTACSEVNIVNYDSKSASSGVICSGRVSPRETITKEFSIIIGELCDAPRGLSWNDVCHMQVNER